MTTQPSTPADPARGPGRAEAIAAAERAAACFAGFAATTDRLRADLLRDLAAGLEQHRDAFVAIADRETALGTPRLSGEIDRTAFQLRAFADYVADGRHRRTVREEAIGGAPPAGRPALIRTHVPIGPVAVFAPSNFPFAFSVLGGDTAAALAAGNPVVVKAHRGHPELSQAVARMAREIIRRHGLPEDVLQLMLGASRAGGLALVAAPPIAAVGFTGSLAAGRDLMRAIATREVPIPFYGELSSVNPVVALPAALAARGADLAARLAASITQGTGQFCTSPGVLLLLDDPASRVFLDQLSARLAEASTHRMLTPGIREQFEQGVADVTRDAAVRCRTGGGSRGEAPSPTLVEVASAGFLNRPQLREEIFGPYCIAVTAAGPAEIVQLLDAVGGSLTATIWADEDDTAAAGPIVEKALALAGRVIFSGVPTGVAVTEAQQHGGPWPSSSRPDTTSVGLRAIDRFMRPVTLQDLQSMAVLPPALREALAMDQPPAENPRGRGAGVSDATACRA